MEIARSGLVVRIQYQPSEYWLYDFAHRKSYRILPSERLYFENEINAQLVKRAERERWAPGISAHLRIPLGTAMIGEVSYSLLLLKNGSEHLMVWEAPGSSLPRRVVFNDHSFHTFIIEYQPAVASNLGPLDFAPPPDFLSVTPF